MSERDDLDVTIERAVRALQRPVPLGAGFDARVMAAVRAEARLAGRPAMPGTMPAAWVTGSVDAIGTRRVTRRALDWLVRPREVRLSPLAGLAAAAAIAAVAALGARTVDRADAVGRALVASAGQPAPTPTGAVVRPAALTRGAVHPAFVRFVFVAPHAAEVSLVGDFNDWAVGSTPLRPVRADGVWSVEVPLTPGRHRYAFVVNGTEWAPDPGAPTAPGDDFGTPSSVVTVVERGA